MPGMMAGKRNDRVQRAGDFNARAQAVVDKTEIRRAVREANQLRKIAINCITFGDKNDTDFLAPMAKENGGGEIWFDGELVRKDGIFVVEDLKALNPENLLG